MFGLLFDYWSSALDALKANRTRSVLTVLGVVIGVALVIVLISLGEACKVYVANQVGGMGFGGNALVVHPGKMDPPIEPSKLSYDDVKDLSKRVAGVVDHVPILVGSAYVRIGKSEYKTSIWGLTDNYPNLVNYHVQRGRFFSGSDVEQHRKVCVLGQMVCHKLFAGRDPVGETVRISGRRFRVLGLMESKGEMLGVNMDDMVAMPVTTASDLLDTQRLTEVVVWGESAERLPAIRTKVADYLTSRHFATDDFHFHTQAEMLSILGTLTNTLTLVVAALASVSLVVGAVGITNIMLVSVMERTREIGIRKALGARSRDIFWQFFIEALVVSLTGGVLGITLGCVITTLANRAVGLPNTLSIWSIELGFVNSAMVGLISGALPAWRAAKADPIQALRYG